MSTPTAAAPTSHPAVVSWVEDVADLTAPDEVVWCDGSAAEWAGLKFDHTKIAAALKVDTTEWVAETRLIDEWYARIGGNTLPDVLREELGALKLRLADLELGDVLHRRGAHPTSPEKDSRRSQPQF